MKLKNGRLIIYCHRTTAQSQGAKRIFNMFTLYSLSDGEIDRFMINEQTGFELASISIFTNVKSNMRKICYLFL